MPEQHDPYGQEGLVAETQYDAYGANQRARNGGGDGGGFNEAAGRRETFAAGRNERPMSGRLEQSRRGGEGAGTPGAQQWEENRRPHVSEGRREMMPSWADGGGRSHVGPSYHETHNNTRNRTFLGSETGLREDLGVRYGPMGGDGVRGASTTTTTTTTTAERGERRGGNYQQQQQHRHRSPQREGSPPSSSSRHHHRREQQEYGYTRSVGAPGGAVVLHHTVPAAAAANAGVSTRASTMHNPVDHEELARIRAKKDAYRRDLGAQVCNEKVRLWA